MDQFKYNPSSNGINTVMHFARKPSLVLGYHGLFSTNG